MRCLLSVFISMLGFFVSYGQYTDQINSNRPGASIGAFSVGKNVVQFEGGSELRTYKHRSYNNSKVNASIFFLSVRYGLLSEKIELTYDGVYQFDKIENLLINTSAKSKRKGFLNNFLGIKYLVYDPFKKERKVNVYSWKANNGFKLRDLIPAVSVTLGGNFILETQTFIEALPNGVKHLGSYNKDGTLQNTKKYIISMFLIFDFCLGSAGMNFEEKTFFIDLYLNNCIIVYTYV